MGNLAQKFKKSRRGFTLMELLVVVTVLGVLSSGAVIGFEKIKASSRDDKRISDLAIIKTALNIYYMENDKYPVSDGNPPRVKIGGNGHWSKDFAEALVPKYIGKLPADPLYSKIGDEVLYVYRVDGVDKSSYTICAKMEEKSDYPCACVDEKANSEISYHDYIGGGLCN